MRALALFLVVFVGGCGGSAQFQGRLTALEARVVSLEKSFAALEQRAAGDDVRQQSADVRLALATMDEMSARVQSMTQDLEQRHRDVAVLLDDLTSRVMKLESASAESVGPRVDASAKEMFDRARTDLDAGRTELAAMGFRSFIDQYPGSSMAADAQFLIGETFYVRDQFEDARIEYQKVVDQYPSGTKRPLAMLRAGICLANTGRSDQAAATLRRLIETYPGTNEAVAARERLADFQ